MEKSTEISQREKLLAMIRMGSPMTTGQKLRLTAMLSIPAILSQMSTIIMEYIDAAMVGSLGASASASIGLMATSTWLFCGLCAALCTGFSVQVAHRIGASDLQGAQRVLRQSFMACIGFSLVMAAIGVCISGSLPVWLGGKGDITAEASHYFLIFTAFLPIAQLCMLSGAMLRCSGNTYVPALANVVMCVLDVVFNFFLIFPTRHVAIAGCELQLPGAGMGVAGAALGTGASELVAAAWLTWYLCRRNSTLNLRGSQGSFVATRDCLARALRISSPIGAERIMLNGAQVASTMIVAPLGPIAIAANAFAVTAESLCYMPGYGISEAATALVGQSLGAARKQLARRFAAINVALGMAIMTVMGIIMYIAAPMLMGIITPVEEISALGAEVLRIEAWAEPMFAAAIVSYGVFVGAGDTLVPCLMNLGSIWCVRLTLAWLLVGSMGLHGVWLAMAIELCFRGAIFLWRLASKAWMSHK